MRIRITRRRPGEVDGIDLSTFDVGVVYDVSPSLATYLIMTGHADPDERPSLVVPIEEMQPPTTVTRASEAPAERAVAADRPQPVDERD
jgi:hypothetical protein